VDWHARRLDFQALKHDTMKCKAFATNMFDKNYDGENHALEDKCEDGNI
jgi:hypothetical protein